MFKHIHGHQGALVILTRDSVRQRFMLNEGNVFSQSFPFEFTQKFSEESEKEQTSYNKNDDNTMFWVVGLLALGIIIIVVLLFVKRQKLSKT